MKQNNKNNTVNHPPDSSFLLTRVGENNNGLAVSKLSVFYFYVSWAQKTTPSRNSDGASVNGSRAQKHMVEPKVTLGFFPLAALLGNNDIEKTV